MTRRMLREMATGDTTGRSHESRLTDRELEVLARLGEGLTIAEIARALHLSGKTVETHRSNLRAKLGLANNAQLLHYAVVWRLG
jgi:DNA-binding CsgD family transcriptional regulator